MKKKPIEEDDEIDSDEIPDVSSSGDNSENEEDGDQPETYFQETPEEKRLRLAKQYLESIKTKVGDDDEAVGDKLAEDYAEEKGFRFAPVTINEFSTETDRHRAHKSGRPSSFALGPGFAFSGAKNGELLRVEFEPRKIIPIGQTDTAIFSVAYYHPAKLVATGQEDGSVRIWDSEKGGELFEMVGHKGPVYGVVFRSIDDQVVSCSADGTIRIWNYTNGMCLGTKFGHTNAVVGIDNCISTVTCGSDLTVRMWNYEKDTYLMFHGGNIRGSIDSIALFNSRYCISGSQDGKLCLWDLNKKAPAYVIRHAHGMNGWISAVATYKFHRLCATGSSDGFVRLWKVDGTKLVSAGEIPLPGYINDLKFSDDGKLLVAQVSQEQRFGRWLPKIHEARQGLHIIKLDLTEETTED